MIFENWYEKIKRNRESFIEYYVRRFGEENRELITKRFDSLKFCFYVDPSDIDMWIALQLDEDYKVATYNFLKDASSRLDIDISKISLNFDGKYGFISIASDRSIENILRNLFRGAIAYSSTSDDYLFHNLYSFRKIEDFINGEGKDYDNPEMELLHRRLLFLKDMGDIIIEGRPIDYFESEECKTFLNSSRYKDLMAKYGELAEMAMRYKKNVDFKYKDLIDYKNKSMQIEEQVMRKYDALKSKENDSSKIEEYEKAYKREIASLRIICGNFEISDKDADCIVDNVDSQIMYSRCDASGQLERIIFFCPFKAVPGYEDVQLRHEIRHGITSSVSIEENITTHKTGNKIEKFIDGQCVECQLSDWNEWVTQSEAIKETRDAFSKGIYIISKPNIRNQNVFGQTSDYDDYLLFFEIIYNAILEPVNKSQIEPTNTSLYSIIPLTQLMEIENMILNGKHFSDELVDNLYKILKQYNLSDGVPKR